jgi:hypothetical protein
MDRKEKKFLLRHFYPEFIINKPMKKHSIKIIDDADNRIYMFINE